MPSDAPRCGDIKAAVAHEFRVEKLIRGKLKQKTVVALIPCPDLEGDKFFEVKSIYEIEATTDLKGAASYTVYNDYVDRSVLWSINIRKLEQKRK